MHLLDVTRPQHSVVKFAHLIGCSITRKTVPPPWRPYIYKTNLFTKFHDEWANNVTSRVHVIQMTGTIFELNSCIKETNVLTKFNENWAKNVTSRVEKCPPTGTIFNLVRDINKTNVLTNFDDWAKIVNSRPKTANILTKCHKNWSKNVTSRVFTCFHYIHIEKNAPPTDGHISIKPIVLTNFHDDWAKSPKKENGPATGGHVFQRTGTTFELNQHIIKANILTNFKYDRDIIGTNLLTKFREDRTINPIFCT
ncbi:hypothetical protein DPMN_045549 [Dreissena polymorpha]|uniref:Uncharacterized protein n=1 Tax=Dreissena polymorpha TaxID=45954 RepID=A0A9D4D6R3_DREPO|nr:hypothetical protein DPMN_045549 [Dreissena polymorpha]